MIDFILSHFKVNRDTPVPIYQQLQSQFEDLIALDTWGYNEPLPPETKLANILDISVMTVRQAMTRLVSKGLITREKGRGTFVVPHPIRVRSTRLSGFSEDIRARAMVPSSNVLEFEHTHPPAHVATALAVPTSDTVLYVKRLRKVNGKPICVEYTYLTTTNLTRRELEETGSLYMSLENQGVRLVTCEERMVARLADDELARLLGIRSSDPILRVTRLTWDKESNPIEYVVSDCRGDAYEYSRRLER